jgi:heterodisulfide reductase subunit A2
MDTPCEVEYVVENPVVIVGGGIAGLSVAKTLVDSGIACAVVERELSLGGHARQWACMATGRCQRCFCCIVEDLVRYVNASPEAKVMTGWDVSSVTGSGGNGTQVCLHEVGTGKEVVSDARAVVFATGFDPYNPAEKILWGHGRVDHVYTLAEVDALMRDDRLSQFLGTEIGLRVAFFQCVGSRDASSGANYCSQYCCKAALRMALKLIHECHGIEITIFYIDLQVAGKFAGDLLAQAAQSKVRLCQGVPGEIVQGSDGTLQVIVEQQGKNVREPFDRVILSIGQRPASVMMSQASRMGLAVNEFGFLEPLSALDSSRTATQGIYVAGASSGPKDIEQTLEHAGQTAAAILADLQGGAFR